MFDQSDHMGETYFEGPDAERLCGEIGVNTLKNFGPGRAKHLICVSEEGLYLGDCTLSCYGDHQLGMCGVPTTASWAAYIAETRRYDVAVHWDPPTLWNTNARRFFHGADAGLPSGALCHLVPGAQARTAAHRGSLLGYGTVTTPALTFGNGLLGPSSWPHAFLSKVLVKDR